MIRAKINTLEGFLEYGAFAMSKELATYQQQTYDYVRNQIINLGFKPGEFITDAQIAEKLSVSRTPVREAFQKLEKEGLLVNESRKGWRVYMLDLEDIYEIFDLKIAIECMVVQKAAKCHDKSLRRDLEEALEGMKKATKSIEAVEWLQADIHLHNILFLMANNERAENYINNLNDQWHRLRLAYVALQGRTEKSIIEHTLFVTSVLEGDVENASNHMCAHLIRVRDDLIKLVEKVILPFSNHGF